MVKCLGTDVIEVACSGEWQETEATTVWFAKDADLAREAAATWERRLYAAFDVVIKDAPGSLHSGGSGESPSLISTPSSGRRPSEEKSGRGKEDLRFLEEGADVMGSPVIEAQLAQLVGLNRAKSFVRELGDIVRAGQLRRDAGYVVDETQSLHMAFTGNPGTGKTTVARVVAQLLRDLGALRTGQLVEADRSQLVGAYLGQTAIKTRQVVEAAIGGVLFIDEAHSLTAGHDGVLAPDEYGAEAVNTLVKLMDDHRHELVVILAGYAKQMESFLSSNPGLRSRVPTVIDFPDYTTDELVQVARLDAKRRGYHIDDAALAALRQSVEAGGRRRSGAANGRLARNVIEEAIRRQSTRIVSGASVSNQALVTLTVADYAVQQTDYDDASAVLAELDSLVGLAEVKNIVHQVRALATLRRKRRELSLPVGPEQSLHMVFRGGPGTGKTTVARLVGRLFASVGVLPDGHLVEVDRSQLVAGWVGQTAIKTRSVVERALGGVLFIDEAYSLSSPAQLGQDFGREAIDTLVKLMDDHRESLVVILAGYDENMEELLVTNPGLRSRFPLDLRFPDFGKAELFAIALQETARYGVSLDYSAQEYLEAVCSKVVRIGLSGNGRLIRNLVEHATRAQAVRLVESPDSGPDTYQVVLREDIRAAELAIVGEDGRA